MLTFFKDLSWSACLILPPHKKIHHWKRAMTISPLSLFFHLIWHQWHLKIQLFAWAIYWCVTVPLWPHGLFDCTSITNRYLRCTIVMKKKVVTYALNLLFGDFSTHRWRRWDARIGRRTTASVFGAMRDLRPFRRFQRDRRTLGSMPGATSHRRPARHRIGRLVTRYFRRPLTT